MIRLAPMSFDLSEVVKRVAVGVAAAVVATIVAGLFPFAVDNIQTELLARVPRGEIFEYESVEFVGLAPDGSLRMESRSAWFREIDSIEWVDELHCDPGGGIWSTQTTEARAVPARDMTATRWTYGALRPTDDRACNMRSNITAEIRGVTWSQTVDSAPFIPGG